MKVDKTQQSLNSDWSYGAKANEHLGILCEAVSALACWCSILWGLWVAVII